MVYKISSNSNSKNCKEKGYIFKNKGLGESYINPEIKKILQTYVGISRFSTVLSSTGFSISCVQYVTL